MRPLKLEIQGFTAFRERQDVSFVDLDLFVVTGPTGAGKSSLLDAMIYALFGRVPRMGAQGLSDLVSHGLAEARINLEFAVGDNRYRVARRLRRVGASSATFERADGDGWLSDVEGSGVKAVDRRIQELVKLDFDAFTRAVVLPQGEFQRFLRGDLGQRREVLTDLLGLKYYLAMGARARARANRLEASVTTTQQIIDEQYADATPERLAQAQADHDTARERAAELAGALASANELDGKATTLRQARQGLERHIADAQAIRSTLSEKLEACQHAREREDALGKAANDAQERSNAAEAQVGTAQRNHARIVSQYGTLEELVRAEGALQIHRQCRQDLAAREQRLATVTAELVDLATEAEAIQAEVVNLKEALEAAKAEAQQAQQAAEEANGAAVEAADRLSKAESALSELGEAEKEAAACAQRLQEVVATTEQAKSVADAAEADYVQLTDENAAATLAQHLRAGDPCPVCHHVLDAAPDVDLHVAEELAAARERHDKARGEVEQANRALATAGAQDTTAQQRLQRAQIAVDGVLDGLEGVNALREQASGAAATKTQRAEELAAARTKAETASEVESDARVRVEGLTTTLAANTSTRDDLTNQCGELRGRVDEAAKMLRANFEGEIPADAEAQLMQRHQAVSEAGQALENKQQESGNAQAELQQATQALFALREELSGLDADIAGLRARCEALYRSMSEAVALVAYAGKVPRLPTMEATREARVSDLSSWCRDAETTVVAADGAGEQALIELDEHLARLAALHQVEVPAQSSPAQVLAGAERLAREAEIRCDEAVQQAEKRLGDREQLMESVAEQQAEIQILKSLASELRADRFIQFIIQQTLDLLAVRASDQLMRISADRYSLVSHEGEFYVIDHVNADDLRSVKTLSGGETFLASLSLALALSQHVGELAMEGLGAKLEAVFIDEGFGALDPETLEDVIDALERLRESDLMVGVITHVSALAERIRVGIRIEKEENKSTVIRGAA